MANVTLSPNMGLPVPIVGVDLGPDWANNINGCLSILDQHSHANGSGVQITPSAININSALAFNDNQAISLQAATFTQQSSLATLNALWVGTDGNLYFNDGAGDPSVQLTLSGAVNATSSGISNGTATAAFSTGVIVVNQSTNTPGNIQAGSVLLGNNTAGSNFNTLAPPSSLGASQTITLPVVPAASSFLTMDTSGNIGTAIPTSKGITRSNLAAVGQQVSGVANFTTSSTSNVTITGLTVTLTTSGRPVIIMFSGIWDIALGGGQSIGSLTVSNNAYYGFCITQFGLDSTLASGFIQYPGSSLNCMDTTVVGSPGTYTYSVQIRTLDTRASVAAIAVQMFAYEL
jgi:hypothetical protein